jgi:hypothetical protein
MLGCLKFKNKVKPETKQSVGSASISQDDFIEKYFIDQNFNDITNTVFMTLYGAGSERRPHEVYYVHQNNTYIERLPYNSRNTVFDVLDARSDAAGLKAYSQKCDLSTGMNVEDLASTTTRAKIVQIKKRILHYIQDESIENIVLVCVSHGSLIIHYTLLQLASILGVNIKQGILNKLKVITIGSPRTLPKQLFSIFGRTIDNVTVQMNSVSLKSQIDRSMDKLWVYLTHKQTEQADNTVNTIALLRAQLNSKKINTLPSILNCYHKKDTVINLLRRVSTRGVLNSFYVPQFPEDKLLEPKNFWFDTQTNVLYVNNTSSISMDAYVMKKDYMCVNTIDPDKNTFYPYYPGHKTNFHVSMFNLYPLFTYNICYHIEDFEFLNDKANEQYKIPIPK